MNTSPEVLVLTFQRLTDAELQRQCASGDLTEEAQAIALAELSARGLGPLPPPQQASTRDAAPEDGMHVIARFFDATQAQLLHASLVSAGIPAVLVDADRVEPNVVWAMSSRGARVLVPVACVEDATALIAAAQRGEFQLDENQDVGRLVPEDEA